MTNVKESDRRICGRTVEGFGEYRTVWNDYEYRCPECGEWHRNGGEISLDNGDGTESFLCRLCGDRVWPSSNGALAQP